jgi:outer membrane protein TolC
VPEFIRYSAVALLLAVGSPARAEPVLTLDDAFGEAKARNLDLKAAQARLRQASTVARKAWSGYLPRIAVGGGYTYNQYEAKLPFATTYVVRDLGLMTSGPFNPDEPPSETNLPGGPTTQIAVPNMDATGGPLGPQAAPRLITVQAHDMWAGRATLDQALLAPALIPAIQQAELAGKIAELSVEAARREILFAVAQVYYGAVGLKEAVAVQEALLGASVAHEKDAKVRVDAGTQPKIALLRAQIDRARAEQDLVRSRNAYLGVKSTLAALLDREPDFEVAMPGEPQVPAGDLGKAASARPDVEAARLGLEAAEKGRLVSWLKYAPNLGFNATYQLSNITGFTGQNGAYSLGVGLSWNLFDGGLREAEVAEAGARLEEASASVRAAEVKVQDEVRRAKLELASALASRAKADEQLKLARESRQLVEVSFQAGVATYVEVSDATTALTGAEMSRLAETLNAQLAVLKLAKAAGAFDP